RKHRGAEGSRGRGREWAAGKDRAQGGALVRLHGDPDSLLVGAPRENGREGWVAVVVEALKARHGGRGFGLGNRDFVHDSRLAALQDGLPALAPARSYEFD